MRDPVRRGLDMEDCGASDPGSDNRLHMGGAECRVDLFLTPVKHEL